jgi:hypothetical protein
MGPSQRRTRTRFWVETALAGLTGALLLLTLSWHDWLEALGIDPDNHSGAVEWRIVAGLFTLFIAFAVSVWREWRRKVVAR